MISNDAQTKIVQGDVKATREFGKLAGGAIGVAVGAEWRREETELQPTTGTERGNVIGLGYPPIAVRATSSRCTARRWRPCCRAWK
ncbi:hypothetical protein [Massilia sp. Se16.2.3]|uniref:hypothetical protein n=1 Tax=Massilia sp. Se16.2.3 TaxID=2709303 RepID=UPI001E401EA7|nr:hypothetical protein [Massilia sp. Se16.2.3]